MLKFLTCLLLSILIILSYLNLQAQTYNFKCYSIEDGLAQSQVREIIQDKQGYLWFATNGGGVSKFDGKSFTNYTTNDGLAYNIVYSMTEDKEGNIWFGTYGGGICKFDGIDFTTLTTADGLINDKVWSISFSQDGDLWIGTQRGYCKYNGQEFIIYEDNHKLKYKSILAIHEDKNKQLWLGVETKGLLRCNLDTQINKKLTFTHIPDKNTLVGAIQSMYVDSDGNLWFNSWGHGAFKYNYAIEKAGGKSFTNSSPNVKGAKIIWTTCEDSNGDYWFGTEYSGVYQFDGINYKNFGIQDGLNSNKVYSIYLDNENNLWFGTDRGGVCKYTNDAVINFTKESGLANDVVGAIMEDRKGNIWMGTNGGAVNFNGTQFQTLTTRDGLTNNKILCMLEDTKEHLWFGTDHGGLCNWDGKNMSLFIHKRDGEGHITNNIVYTLEEDKEGNIWVGTDKGVSRINEGKITRYCYTDSIDPDKRIIFYDLYNDRKNNLWAGTNEGVMRFDSNEFIDFDHHEYLHGTRVNAIIDDPQGNLWFGTYGKGLIVCVNPYEEKPDSFILYDKSTGLSSNEIMDMAFDDEGNLWVGTIKGLNKLDIQNNKVTYYGREKGFAGIECSLNGVIKDSKGNIWYGTVSGATKLNPAKEGMNEKEPSTYITDLSLFFEKVNWGEQYDKINTTTGLPINLALPYYKNHATFSFIGISLTIPKKVRYQYMMEGLDGEWSPVTKETYATYSSIPPGEYTFKVKACNNDGIWNKNPTSYSFVITHPYWQTWTFRISVGLLLIGLVLFIVYRKINKIKQEERKRFEFNKRIIESELKTLRAQMNPHFIFNSLNSIQRFITENAQDDAGKYLTKFAKLMRMILDNSRREVIPIEDELKSLKLYIELEALRFGNKFAYSIQVDPEIDVGFIEIPPMIIQPYVENAIKHGLMNKEAKGNLKVEIKLNGQQIICVIEDDGIGREKANELRSQLKPDHKSHGLDITQERLEIINQDKHSDMSVQIFDLKDDKNNPLGTRVEFYLPVND